MTVNKKKEIELKYYIGQEVADLRRRIVEGGWKSLGVQIQSDTYYTSRHRDFITTEECLRIRRAGSHEELTWKPPTSAAMRSERQYWKEELNVDISSQSRVVSEMLQRLDFIEYVTVDKKRELFRVDGDSIVALDHINSLGWFVEIETSFEAGREKEGVTRNYAIAQSLGLSVHPQIDVPYRDMVKLGRVEGKSCS